MNTTKQLRMPWLLPRLGHERSARALAIGVWLAAGAALAAPANDDFANAIDLTGTGVGQTGDAILGSQTGTNNTDATLEAGEPDPGATNTVWFKWTCPADGDLIVDTFGSTDPADADWDAILGIYAGAALNALTPLGATPQDTGLPETMTVPVIEGATYHIQLAGFNNALAANIVLNWELIPTIYQADMLAFGPGGIIGEVVDNAAAVAWSVPFGSNLATLAPTFTLSPGATCTVGGTPVVSGTPIDFSGGPVVFTVTARGLTPTVNAYTVTVTKAPDESALTWNLPSGGDWDFTTANWLGETSQTTQPFANALNVIFNNTAGGTINIPSSVYPLSTTVSAPSGTYTFSGGPIASGSLTKSGNGNLTITTVNNTYDGGTIINAGQLQMNTLANGALGTGSITLNGGRLRLERITAANDLIVNGGDLFPTNGFGNTLNGTVTLNSNLVVTSDGNAGGMNFNGAISGNGGLTFNGPNALRPVLAVANSYTGPTSVTSCTLQCNHVDALGSGALTISSTANSKVNLNYSGTKNIAGLTLGGVPQLGGTHGSTASDATYKNDTYFSGTGTVTVPPSSAKDIVSFSFGALGDATINGTTITLEVPSGTDRTNLAPTYTVSPGASGSPVSGTPRNFTTTQTYIITAEDLSTQEFSVTVIETVLPDIFTWASATTGNWSVASNWINELETGSAPLASGRPSYTLNFTAPGTYTATNNLSVTGFQLNVLNLAATVTLAGNPLAFVADGETLPTINQNSGSAVTISNALDFGANMTYGGSGGGQVTLTGLITGAGSLTKNGSGTLRIDNINNSFAGGTIINSGTFFGGIDAKVGAGPITLNGGVLYMWRFKPTNAVTVNGGSITSENGFNQNLLAGPVTLNATLPILAPFQLTFSNTISGVGGLTKTGNGTVILSNTCTSSYTGPTTVTAGTLRCDRPEALSGSSAISISGTGKMNLNYVGTKTVASLTLGGEAKTAPGTYGSVASGAEFPSDTFFTPGSTGTLTIAAGGYGAWAATNGVTGGVNGDSNNDGVQNGVAYFMNDTGLITNPGVTGNTVTWPNGGNIPATEYGADKQFVVQTSPDLVTWTPVAIDDLTTNTSGPGGSLTYTLPQGGPKLFVRLLVTPTL